MSLNHSSRHRFHYLRNLAISSKIFAISTQSNRSNDVQVETTPGMPVIGRLVQVNQKEKAHRVLCDDASPSERGGAYL